MKKFFQYTAILSVLFTLSSCKDFLTERPQDFFETNNFYTDRESLHTGLLGVYQKINQLYSNVNVAFIGTLGTDESLPLYYANEVAQMYKYTAKADFAVYEIWYTIYYEAIARANFIMEVAPSVPGVDNFYVDQVIAECKVLRAWSYFKLVQTFGPLALIEGSVKSIDYSVPRSPIADVYDRILTDLKDALASGSLLQAKPASESGRITQDIATAILGKVYLTMASSKKVGVTDRILSSIGKSGFGHASIPESVESLYGQASSTLKPLVDKYTLYPHYGEVFCNDNKNNIEENMWELQYIDAEPGGSSWKKRMGLLWFPPTDQENMLSNASGWSQVNYTPHLWALYKEGDARKRWNMVDYILFKGAEQDTVYFNPLDGSTNEAYYSWCGITKYRFDADASMVQLFNYRNVWNLPINTTIIRFADVLLCYAEAEMGRNGGAANLEAVEAVNAIRTRARGIDIPEEATPDFKNFTVSDLTTDAVLEERLFELCFENVRWFDLVRTGMLIEKYHEPVIVGNYAQGTISENNYLLPIPQSQIDLSDNKEGFFQNPGY